MRFSSSVQLASFRLFGFSFNYLGGSEGARFLMAFREAVPMRMWDSYSRRWWVPELYTPIVQTVAGDFGALDQRGLDDLQRLRNMSPTGARAASIDAAYTTLGLHPDAPPRLVDMALAYWRSQFQQIPTAQLEADACEAAYAQIQEYLNRSPA